MATVFPTVYGADGGANGKTMPARTVSRSKHPTWRDYQEPGSPEPETFTRPQFVERLRTEGLDVSPRTLAYWESEGIIPRSVREWRDVAPQSVYPAWMLDVVRTVRGMQAEGATLEQIRDAIAATPWLSPMAPPVEAAERWNAYERASRDLAPKLAELARLRELAYGVRIVGVAIHFRDANGATSGHSFGAPFAWLGDDASE